MTMYNVCTCQINVLFCSVLFCSVKQNKGRLFCTKWVNITWEKLASSDHSKWLQRMIEFYSATRDDSV